MQRQQYNSTFAVSQSAIKQFRYKSPRKWKDIWVDRQLDLDKDEDAFTFGSLVDTILFTPELIEERFYIADVSKIPTGNVEKIVRQVFDSNPNLKPSLVYIDDKMLPETEVKEIFLLSHLRSEILDTCNKLEWNQGWKDDTRINKIIEKGQEYFNLLSEAKGRKVITSEVNLDALNVVNKLKQDKNVQKYFIDTDTTKNVFQLELFDRHISSDHFSVPLKCAIDILHIDHELRTLTVCDFKTSHSAFNFIQSVKQFGYCDQLSFYVHMVELALESDEFRERIGINKKNSPKVWKVVEPINVVIDESEQLPYIYEYDWKDINIAKLGNASYLFNLYQTRDHGAKLKRGWLELLEEICWHIHNDSWDYPVEFYKTGKIKVNLTNS